jgi:hypothetical protein
MDSGALLDECENGLAGEVADAPRAQLFLLAAEINAVCRIARGHGRSYSRP